MFKHSAVKRRQKYRNRLSAQTYPTDYATFVHTNCAAYALAPSIFVNATFFNDMEHSIAKVSNEVKQQ